MDINAYHRSTAHTHHRLLLRSAEQQVMKPKRNKLLPCVGCWMAKGISALLNKVTECHSVKKLEKFLPTSVVQKSGVRFPPKSFSRFFWEKKGNSKSTRESEVECTTIKNARLKKKEPCIEEKPGADGA